MFAKNWLSTSRTRRPSFGVLLFSCALSEFYFLFEDGLPPFFENMLSLGILHMLSNFVTHLHKKFFVCVSGLFTPFFEKHVTFYHTIINFFDCPPRFRFLNRKISVVRIDSQNKTFELLSFVSELYPFRGYFLSSSNFKFRCDKKI